MLLKSILQISLADRSEAWIDPHLVTQMYTWNGYIHIRPRNNCFWLIRHEHYKLEGLHHRKIVADTGGDCPLSGDVSKPQSLHARIDTNGESRNKSSRISFKDGNILGWGIGNSLGAFCWQKATWVIISMICRDKGLKRMSPREYWLE